MKQVVKYSLPDEIPVVHENALLNRIYVARGIRSTDELVFDWSKLLPPRGFKDLDKALKLLYEALSRHWRVTVIGDYDTDGATSTALMVQGLSALGADGISYFTPNRFTHGYGLSPEIVKEVALRFNPQLLITVDNGSSSFDAVNEAQKMGIKVLITDHHAVGELLPAADALINPQRSDDEFPSKNLAGVGVAFYLLLALRSYLREQNWFADRKEPNFAAFLDLVTLGTIADSVPLDYNNRLIVAQGIKRIRKGKMRIGLKCLLESANKDYQDFSTYEAGFVVAPRLNAAGRMEDMSLSLELLLANNAIKAQMLVARLEQLNEARRSCERNMLQQVGEILADRYASPELIPAGVTFYDESWHPGVMGILASRVKDLINRPVAIFTKADAGELRGSIRSVEGIHIRNLLSQIAEKHPGLLLHFGGHAMAAGVTILARQYDLFTEAFAEAVGKSGVDDTIQTILVDGTLNDENCTLENAMLLCEVGLWGAGFNEPQFYGEFEILKQGIIGERHLKLQLRFLNGKNSYEALAFNIDPLLWQGRKYTNLQVVYRLAVNKFKQQTKLQLTIVEILAYA